jgi:NADPH:quinone reductase
MRAWVIDGFDGIDTLRLTDLPDPQPGPGEVLLRVHFASLNPADYYLAEGQYPAKPIFPHVLGRDGVGTVVRAGSGVTNVRPGDIRGILRGEAGVNRPGAFAELVVVPVVNLIEVPPGWTQQQTAAAPLVYVTALQALTMWGELPPGSVVLITGASGGVGVASIHLARALGHVVIALSRSEKKREELRELGAQHTYDPHSRDWRKALRADLQDRRVDLAIDNVGGPLLPQVIDTLGMHGRVSIVGRLAGPVDHFNTASLLFRRLRIGGVAIGSYTADESQTAWKTVLDLLNRTGARPVVDSQFAMGDLPKAFARLKDGPMGKVLLVVSR